MTTLKRTDVERIAALAHLDLTEAETALFTRQLGDILAYFDRLQQIDTTGVPATTHPVTSAPVMRDDDPRPQFKRLLYRLWLSTPDSRALPEGHEVLWRNIGAGQRRGGILQPAPASA